MSRKNTIEDMRRIASVRGGKCLSEVYIDQKTDLDWECRICGHIWRAKPTTIKGSRNKRGTWCPPCGTRNAAKARMRPIEDLQHLAEERGGVFASPENLGSNEMHLWRCCHYPSHPEFPMIPNAVQQGQWCPKCGGTAKPTFDEINELARERSQNPLAQCRSTDYQNTSSILQWWCGVDGHPYINYAYKSVKYERVFWCDLCKQERSRPTKYNRDMLVRLATRCGGILLSEESYRNPKQKHQWRCQDGHEFSRSLDDIIYARSFCPYCFQRGGLREQYLRELFFFMFNAPFKRTRKLPWLMNQNGKAMELDGYNPDLALAFEHNGQQHYEIDGYLTTHQDQLTKRYADDEDKVRLCSENGVALIVVPFSVSLKEVQTHVLGELTKAGIQPPNLADFQPGIFHSSMLSKLQEHAASLGGHLISDKYLGSAEDHLWKCKHPEHPPFLMPPSEAISMRHWCDRCDDVKRSESYKISVEQLQVLAQTKGGEMILDGVDAEKKFASYDQVMIRCLSCGRPSIRTVQQIKDGRLCFCRTKKTRIDRSAIEEKLSGASVRVVGSDVISGGKTPVTLQCEKCRHHWLSKASYVMNTTVKCDVCNPSRNAAVTMEKARELGERCGFRLCSETLVNGNTALHYECKKCGAGLDKSYREMRQVRRCLPCAQGEAADRFGLN
jgi:hypothetical protein